MICVGVRLRGSIGYPTVQQQSTTAKIRDTTPDMEGQDRRYISQQILHLESPLRSGPLPFLSTSSLTSTHKVHPTNYR